MTDEQWYAILDVHLTPFRILRAFANDVREANAAESARSARIMRKVVNIFHPVLRAGFSQTAASFPAANLLPRSGPQRRARRMPDVEHAHGSAHHGEEDASSAQLTTEASVSVTKNGLRTPAWSAMPPSTGELTATMNHRDGADETPPPVAAPLRVGGTKALFAT